MSGELFQGVKPCTQCQQCERKDDVAGGFYCKKKKALTSIARITNDGCTLLFGEADECFVDECFEEKEK